MKIVLHYAVLSSFMGMTALGCHSSATPATTVSNTQPSTPVTKQAPAPAAPAAPKKLVCSGLSSDDSNGTDFVETVSLYTLMDSKLGGWTSCAGKKLSKTDEQTTVTFAGGATLTLSSYPSSDSSEGQAVVPPGTSITRDDVIKALKANEPADGCGVNWSQLNAGGPNATGDFKASGTTCTLELHIKMLNGSVVGFGYGVAA